MSFLDDIRRETFRFEGGFTRDPKDPGHQLRRSKGHRYDSYCTNHGITQYTLSSYWRRQATISEVRALSQDEAWEIYVYEYYKKPRFDELPTALQPILFDMGVNHGPKRAVKIMQTTCVKAGHSIQVDGKIGFRTIKAGRDSFNDMGGYFINAMVEERLKFYRFLVRRKPVLKKFMFGWTKRANHFLIKNEDAYIVSNLADKLMGVAA